MATQGAAMGMRERKKRRTRERIIAVARDLFVERGYEATAIADIAEESDIAVSTLFGYFPNKAEILFEGYEAIVDDFVDFIESRRPGELAIEATVRWHTDRRSARSHGEVSAERIAWWAQLRRIIDADSALVALERERYAKAESRLAHAVADDLGDAPDDLRPMLIAAMKVTLMFTMSRYVVQDGSRRADADDWAAYVDRCLIAAADAIAAVPLPTGEVTSVRRFGSSISQLPAVAGG